MITIHKLGVEVSYSAQELADLRRQFEKNDFIRLPNLIDSALLQELYSQIEASEWENRAHDGIGVEICLKDSDLVSLINFVFNDQVLFRTIQDITGCENIGCFQGRVYRMVPASGHYDSWHTDVGDDRLLALSLNFGKQPYKGGTLQIQRKTNEPLEVSNVQFGHAVLFRLSDNMRHRVTNVEGDIPKTAFAGWFKSSPDLWVRLAELSRKGREEPVS